MDSVSLDATSSDKILLLVKSNKTQFQASISKEVLARSPVLRNLRVPLRSSTSLNVPSGYAQIWHKHVQAASKQICSSTDTTDSLSLLLKVCSLSLALSVRAPGHCVGMCGCFIAFFFDSWRLQKAPSTGEQAVA